MRHTTNFDLQEIITQAYEFSKQFVNEGRVADYIPELANANPKHLAIALTDTNGETISAGDCNHRFTIQSICKVILLCTAIEDVGYEAVFKKVGVEPTGDPYNSIVRLENRSKTPLNPMINAGAIAVTSTISGENAHVRLDKVLTMAKKLLANDNVVYDENVYRSESKTGDRNRALIYMMKSNGIIFGDAEEHLEVYFKACSILANCIELAHLGAVLANDGNIPRNSKEIIGGETSRLIRSLMLTCGLYDGSGRYAVNVGIPSKSGVGGGIIGAVPNKYGLAVYSPPLDECGNSLCGIKATEFISRKMQLNIL